MEYPAFPYFLPSTTNTETLNEVQAAGVVPNDFVSLEDALGIEEPFFFLEQQPQPVQRKSYPYSKRKEMRQFKPALIRILPSQRHYQQLHHGTAIMRMVNENMDEIEGHPAQISEMDKTKSFWFHPTAFKTSKGKFYRLQFSINFLLEDGQQKSVVILSNKFRVVSRITAKHLREIQVL